MVEHERHSSRNEWLVFASRLLLLVVVFAAVNLSPVPNQNLRLLYIALTAGVVLAVTALILEALDVYPPALALLVHLLDLVVLLAILYAWGGGYNPLFVLAVAPVVVASIAYGRLVGLASAAVLSVGYGLMLAFSAAHGVDTFGMVSFALTVFVLLLVATVAPGVASEPLHLFPSTAAQPKRLLPDASHDRLKTISRFASTLSATGNHERALDAYLDFMGDLMKEVDGTAKPTARMVFLYSDRHELKLSAWRNLDKEDLARAVSDQRGLVGSAIVGAEPVRGKSAADDPDLKPFVSLVRARSLLCVPLRAGFDLYGAALLASARPDAFDDEHVELITAFSNQAVVALRNARLYQSLQEDRQRIIDTQEEARRRLARELHDGPTQAVSAIAMRLNFTKELVRRDPAKAAAELSKLEELARRTAREIRTMLFTLRPVALETQGLAAALRQYADKLQEPDGLRMHIEGEMEERFSPAVEGIAFSIIEEAVNNARKHAKADNIFVRLKLQQDLFIAEIEDDGRGFDVASVEKTYAQRGSLGLINMRERATLVSGTLKIDSKPGSGTTVTLVIPWKEAASSGSK